MIKIPTIIIQLIPICYGSLSVFDPFDDRLYSSNEEVLDRQTESDEKNDVMTQSPHLAVVDRLAASTVAVVGLGGVGSWAAEALVRSGVGNIILIDLDDICISNTNRQSHALASSVGRMKIEEMKDRLLDINPECNVTNIFDFVSILSHVSFLLLRKQNL